MKITYKQLAFLLDITPLQAIEKLIYAHCKEAGAEIPVRRSLKAYRDYYPSELDALVIQKHTGISILPALMDIKNNYLKRPATRKFILCDYPEKELITKRKDKIRIPTELSSLLTVDDIQTIKNEWKDRYGIQY